MTRFRSHPRLIWWLAFALLSSLVTLLLLSWRTPHRLSDLMTAYNPRWSADGNYLMATCANSIDHTGAVEYELCFAKPDLSGLIRLQDIPTRPYASEPVWAPTGSDLAFGGDDGLLLSTPTLTPSKRLTIDMGCSNPVWSPDGQRIACTSNAQQILVVELATGHIAQVTTRGDNFSPQWVKNGQAVIFEHTVGDEPPRHDLYLVDLATQIVDRLIADLRPYQHAVVSPDGSQVLYLNEEQTSFTITNLNTGASENLLAPYQACLGYIQDPQ